ncbi:MAG: methyl-accepting chemotaxis protein, partial [Bdellovibrionales bacterium]|nr:methyl-accepting chemotaxis protein [Bdellovibrionales bacterium]
AERYKKEVQAFYEKTIGEAYQQKVGKAFDASTHINKLDAFALAAQFDFIVDNENPLGKKDRLNEPKRKSLYGDAHAKHHQFFSDYQQRRGLYDVFLVNKVGRVTYTVFKEIDFGTSLRNGPWSQTGLANAFEHIMKLKQGEVYFEDFQAYTPSYEAPASFAGSPIYEGGEVVGALMIQLPIDQILAIASDRIGLGEKGETLLVGSDGRLRANTIRNAATHNLELTFKEGSKVSVKSAAVEKAQSGETGFFHGSSYDQIKTLAYYRPIKAYNLKWAIVTELASEEVFAALHRLNIYLLAIIGVGVICISFFSYGIGNSIARHLKGIASSLDRTSKELGQASQKSAQTSGSLSESSTEQASSIQETMASAEEISAMVNQNADSAVKALQIVTQNQKSSEEGTRSIGEMTIAIKEIREANGQILQQMETSNREFAEIVKIISEIGEKTNVINEIVFQTKLLSFNASVEAARAGEHGKGFAVVAEEVGNLAQMSGNAAKEITDMLSDSIRKVNGIVENTRTRVDGLIEIGKDKIATGQATAEKCKFALEKIGENATAISQMISEIANASKEQAQGVSEINKAIGQMDQVTQQNSVSAQESADQAGQLKTHAHVLHDAVVDFVQFIEGSEVPVEEGEASAPKSSGNVVSMKKAKVNAGGHPRETAFKAAASGDSVPSGSHAGFEEF